MKKSDINRGTFFFSFNKELNLYGVSSFFTRLYFTWIEAGCCWSLDTSFDNSGGVDAKTALSDRDVLLHRNLEAQIDQFTFPNWQNYECADPLLLSQGFTLIIRIMDQQLLAQ